MQLVAQQIRVDVPSFDDIAVLVALGCQAVAVVRHDEFLLAHQLPVVLIRRAGKHVEVIRGTHAVRRGARGVVSHIRRATHAALTRGVEPGQARFFNLVDGLVYQQFGAGQTRRSQNRLAEVEQHVAVALAVIARGLVEQEQILDLGHKVVATRLWHCLGAVAFDAVAAVAHQMVPQHFQARLWQREWRGQFEVGDAVAAFDQLGRGRIVLGGGIYLVRVRGRASSRVNVEFPAVAKAREHGQLTRAELLTVLFCLRRSDAEQRLVGGIRVAIAQGRIVSIGITGQATVPGRDSAGGITGLFGADRGQVLAETRGLGCIDLSLSQRAAQQQSAEQAGAQQS